ncbi:MAG TPA: PDR/VanB family oxidoreductase [Ramlibacter sp.]|nr:PDR/VanB family oxidoreductase [Ramlibacter sp.]
MSSEPGSPSSTPLIPMRLSAIRYGASGISLFEFVPLQPGPLPPFTAGAHVDLHLPSGLVRQYSLCNPQGEQHRYVVGIKRDPNSRGGSRFLHDELRVGTVLHVGAPRNNFELREEARHSVLIAGGIGVTPIACMATRLKELGKSFEVHYSVRKRDEAAFLDLLGGERLHLHVDSEHHGAPLPVTAIVADAPADAHLYCCGPAPMLDAFEAAASSRKPELVHIERFTPAMPAAVAGGFTVKMSRTGGSVFVTPGQTILDALRNAGIGVMASCEQGICGTCETRVLAGTPDHRDSLLSEDERKQNNVMMICCSGSKEDILVLDI